MFFFLILIKIDCSLIPSSGSILKFFKYIKGSFPRISSTTLNGLPLIPILASGIFLIKFMKWLTSVVIPFILRVNAPEEFELLTFQLNPQHLEQNKTCLPEKL